MKDRHQDLARTAAWAFEKLALQMEHTPKAISDRVHGDGFSFGLPQVSRFLDLYPQTHTVAITTPNVEVRFRNVLPPQLAKDGVLIESEDGTTHALFLKNGHIAVEVFPVPSPDAPNAPRTDGIIQNGEIIPSARSGVSGGTGDATAERENPSPRPAFTPRPPMADDVARREAGAVADAEAERLRVRNLRGNVATDPRTDPTPTGKPRVQFLLAEHIGGEAEGETEPTVYHRVYSLNKMAQTAIDRGIHKGQKVAVSGYRQQREHETKDGTKAQGEVIYANQIRLLGQRREPAPEE